MHVHELQALLNILDPEEKGAAREGDKETTDNLAEVKTAGDALLETLAQKARRP